MHKKAATFFSLHLIPFCRDLMRDRRTEKTAQNVCVRERACVISRGKTKKKRNISVYCAKIGIVERVFFEM